MLAAVAMGALASLSPQGAQGPALALRNNIVVQGQVLFLDDIVDLNIVPNALRARAARIEILTLPRNRLTGQIADAFVWNRARAQMPALARWLPISRGKRVSYSVVRPMVRSSQIESPEGCLGADQAIAPGDLLSDRDFRSVDCDLKSSQRAAGFSRATERIHAVRPIAAGEIIVRFAGYGQQRVAPGDTLTLFGQVGNVRITRSVTALQSAKTGAPLFVRAPDGAIVRAHYMAATQ